MACTKPDSENPKAGAPKVQVAKAADGLWLRLPPRMRDRIVAFMLDERSGSVLFNIHDGKIMKTVIEDHVRD